MNVPAQSTTARAPHGSVQAAIFTDRQVIQYRRLTDWVYRVAHNIASSHVLQRKRAAKQVSLDTLEELPDGGNLEESTGEKQKLAALMTMIRTLKPPDRQVILLYLEDLDAAAISDIVGLKPGAVGTKIHRIKAVLARRFREGAAP